MPDSQLRPALYHRFHRLLPWLVSPRARRGWRIAGRSAAVVGVLGYFAFVALVLALRYWILPNITVYRPDLERLATQAVGLPVTIGKLEASWEGLHPELALEDVRIADRAGRPALILPRVEGVLSWWSLPTLELRLRRLEIDNPALQIRREADGRLLVAGIPVNTQGSGGGLGDWFLIQNAIVVKDATLVWEDAQRGAPALALEAVNLVVQNSGRHHQFGLTALPPGELASRLDIRGDVRGRSFAHLEDWRGQLFTQFDYTDLGRWRQWLDLPVDLDQGRGALRLWAGFEKGRLTQATGDVALVDTRLRLAPSLEALDLRRLQGRLQYTREGAAADDDTTLAGRQLIIQPRDGAGVGPTDFAATWRQGDEPQGRFTAQTLDLGALATLAGRLPLGNSTRQLLAQYAPQGQLRNLEASWRLDGAVLKEYRLKGDFTNLGLAAQGDRPGFAGLSGKLEADQKGGSLSLDAHRAALDFPAIFPEPRIALDSLTALADWQWDGQNLEVDLKRAVFANADAAGVALGTYRYTGHGSGIIDLKANLSRAEGKAVWRYLPWVVAKDARDWVQSSVTAGQASDARLVLKGDLDRFPFRSPRDGQFALTAKVRGATLDYGPGWPVADNIQGELRFAGPALTILAQSGRILGTRVTGVTAEIPDLDARDTTLHLKGKAEGPTGEFLRFIARSPVGDMIGNFTADMKAQGNGRLALQFHMPLNHMVDTKVAGDFDFLNNQVTVDPDLPPLTQVNGRLQFTEKGMRIQNLGAQMFGAPMRLNASTEGDKVQVNAQGNLSAAGLRRTLGLPVLDHLSGSANWRGAVTVQKKAATLVIDSNLLGISSSLPAPLNKSATQSLAFHLEEGALPPDGAKGKNAPLRQQLKMSLGKVASALILRHKEGNAFVTDRGYVALGDAPALPAQGLVLSVNQPTIDGDFWRSNMPDAGGTGGGAGAGSSGGAGGFSFSQTLLKTAQMDIFGRRLHDVTIKAVPVGNAWQVDIGAKELAGNLNWDGFGHGRLKARLRHLIMPDATPHQVQAAKAGEAGEVLDELPALDVVADSFTLGNKRFGRLDLQARNEGKLWRLDRIGLTNPDGSLNGSGEWRPGAKAINRTQLDFKLDAADVGKLLDRLGFPGTVKRGGAKLSGHLTWQGPPTSLDYPSLSGDMKLAAEKGQFAKVEPGIGKLIGLLSLQSLPRRITLDFRDVFSEGFAFDHIEGTVQVQNGLMKTGDFQINGPAAKVDMQGTVNLEKESQDLQVRIQPALGSSVALGTAVLANPVAGVAALVAQKILRNPLDQVFAYQYHVTGTWDDPKVEKLSRLPVGGHKSDGKP